MTPTIDAEAVYREAFEEFSQKAQRVQLLAAQQISGVTFEAALLELEQAHFQYKQARDAFLQSMLPAAAGMIGGEDGSDDISTIAELLWESAGRPNGTADQDWRRAESIVKRARAASTCH